MTALFIDILNMSLTASFAALAVILARFALKKAPRIFSYALWAVVLFRLVCPVSFESPLSAMPVRPNAVPQDIVYAQTPRIQSAAALVDAPVNAALDSSLPEVRPEYSVNPIQVWLELGAYAWLLGVCAMILYALISYFRLKTRLRDATLVSDNLFETDRIESPFVLGFIRPRIYAPAGAPLPAHILLHERAHIRRRDYLVKPVAFLALAVHWFNPLVWLCYFLMARDMELLADEAALKAMGGEMSAKRGYCESLVSMAAKRGAVVPLAFGESGGGGVKARVKNALSFKKPAAWLAAVAAIVVIALCAVLIPNRAKEAPEATVSYGTFSLDIIQPGYYERMASVTLNSDGTAAINPFRTSSFAPPPCTFAVENGELVLRANLKTPVEQGLYGIEDNSVVARFSIEDGGKSLGFLSSPLLLFPDLDEPSYHGLAYMLKNSGSAVEAASADSVPQEAQGLNLVELLEYKTPYVGDNSTVSALVSLLPSPDPELIQQFFSIGDDYGTSYGGVDPDGKTLTIYYEVKNAGVDTAALRRRIEDGSGYYTLTGRTNALMLFSTIQNLEEIAFRVRLTPSSGALDKSAYSDSWYTHRALYEEYCDMARVYEASDPRELSNGMIRIYREYEEDSVMSIAHLEMLAQKGPALTVGDFEGFAGENIGSGFFIMRYDVEGGTLEVHASTAEPDAVLNYARYTKPGFDPLDQALCVDIMQGGEALKAYLEEDTASRVVNMLLTALERACFDRLVSSKAPPAGDPAGELGECEEYRRIKQMDYTALPALSETLEAAEERTTRADIAAALTAEILAWRMLSSQYVPDYTGEEAPLLPVS